MTIAGPDYVFYSENALMAKDRSAHVEAGVLRFLYSRKVSDEYAERQMTFIRNSLAGKDYELVRVTDGDARVESSLGEVSTEPVWRLGQDNAVLLAGLAREHPRIFVENTISVFKASGKSEAYRTMLREAWETIQDHPDTEFIVFGTYVFQLYFLFGFSGGAFSIREPRTNMDRAPVDDMVSPTGRRIYREYFDDVDWISHPHVEKKGMAGNLAYVSLQLLKSVPGFLAEFYSDQQQFVSAATPDELRRQLAELRETNPRKFLRTSMRGSNQNSSLWTTQGDQSLCDSCTVKYACRLYEEGSVCILPGTNSHRLADFFGTRNSDDVLNGVARVVQVQATRFEDAVESENKRRERCEEEGEDFRPDPEINKMANDLVRNASGYAKLINPMLTRPQLQLQINNGTVQQARLEAKDITPAMAARAARELESSGVPRERQNTEMIFDFLSRQQEPAVVEGEVVDGMRRDY